MIIKDIEKAKAALEKNDLVAIPTETVYGLAGNIYSDVALGKIFETKKRPHFNPLIVHIKSQDSLSEVAKEIPEKAMMLATTFWPGPLTLVLKKQNHLSELITAGKNTVAVRVPNHPLALALLNVLDFPLAAPSANLFKSLSPTSAGHVYKNFGEEITILDGGECQLGIESTIIGFEKNEPILYRFGSITVEEIEKVVGKISIAESNNSQPSAPGMLSQHYSPKTKLCLTNDLRAEIQKSPHLKIGVLQLTNMIGNNEVSKVLTLSKTGNLREAAKNFYGALHQLDLGDLDLIIAEKMPNTGLGKTINDRLNRAISK